MLPALNANKGIRRFLETAVPAMSQNAQNIKKKILVFVSAARVEPLRSMVQYALHARQDARNVLILQSAKTAPMGTTRIWEPARNAKLTCPTVKIVRLPLLAQNALCSTSFLRTQPQLNASNARKISPIVFNVPLGQFALNATLDQFSSQQRTHA